MSDVYYEGSRMFMRGYKEPEPEPELTDMQRRILEELSDGKLHSMWQLARRLDVSTSAFRGEIDTLSLAWPVYEETQGQRCSIGILTEACFE